MRWVWGQGLICRACFFYIASELAGAVADHTPKVDSNQAIGNAPGIGMQEVGAAEDV
jgi:hypothetical protein